MRSQNYDFQIPRGRIDLSLIDNLEITTLKFRLLKNKKNNKKYNKINKKNNI